MAIKYSEGVVLDIGCGRMPYKNLFLANKKVEKYIGLDHPDVAKLYKGNEKPDILADAIKIPLPKNSCDTVVCFQVLEHLPNPSKALKEMERVLKPNGKLILSTIQAYALHDEPYDFYRYTKYGLKTLISESGLKVTKISTEGNIFIQISQFFNVFLMLKLKKLLQQKNYFLIASSAPLILTVTTFSNLLVYPFSFFDKDSKFGIIVTAIAKK